MRPLPARSPRGGFECNGKKALLDFVKYAPPVEELLLLCAVGSFCVPHMRGCPKLHPNLSAPPRPVSVDLGGILWSSQTRPFVYLIFLRFIGFR
jgi:hypothetical protein